VSEHELHDCQPPPAESIGQVWTCPDRRTCPEMDGGIVRASLLEDWLDGESGTYSLERVVPALNPKDPMLGRM
jgi:hypothetical protein